VVHVCQLTRGDLHLDATEGPLVVKDVLPEVQHLLTDYGDVFATQVGAPDRLHRHSIPLVPSSRPFHIMLYRYAPSLKDEIEHQGSRCWKLVLFRKCEPILISSFIGEEKE
jgi:hypothetical protein